MTLANSLALTLLAAVCSSSASRLVPLALLLLADRCEATGTVCDNSVPCGSGCPTSVYGKSLCDGTYTGTVVNLFNRGLSGTIPPEMGKLSQLKRIDLFSNSISGTIPSQLTDLFLSTNSISGTIPPETSKLSLLEYLWLYNNDISGTVPSQLNNLPLTNCWLGGTNHFACPLPALPADCTLTHAVYRPECKYPPPSPPSTPPPPSHTAKDKK